MGIDRKTDHEALVPKNKVHIASVYTKTHALCAVGAQWSSCNIITVKDSFSPKVSCLRCLRIRLKMRQSR